MIFDNFDRIRIINLPHRHDRRRGMERRLASIGQADHPRLGFFPAIVGDRLGPFPSAGCFGCFQSHRAVILEAAEAGQSILILEDDCGFLPGVLEYEMPECDVFYGGYVASNPNDLQNSNIIGAHFIGFSARAAKLAADYFDRYLEPGFQPDPVAAAEPGFDPALLPPVDGAYVWFRRAHPTLKTVFAKLSEQVPSRTDIGRQAWFDRVPVVRSIVEAMRRRRAASDANYVFR